jgi:nitroreductase
MSAVRYAQLRTAIAATTMMYEAEELGVHTIWIRGFDSKTVVDTFGLPDDMIPVMMLGLGYQKEMLV